VQGSSRSIVDRACFGRQHFATAHPVVGAHSEPGSKRTGAVKFREVRTDLREDRLRGEDTDPWDSG